MSAPSDPPDAGELVRAQYRALATGTGQDWFPRLLGPEVLALGDGRCRARCQASNLQAPHRYLHGGAIVALADAAAERVDLYPRPRGSATSARRSRSRTISRCLR